MFFDIYMIILTSFAVFGLYTFFDMVVTAFHLRKTPTSVTVMVYSQDRDTGKKVNYLQNNIYNSKIVLIDEGIGRVNIYTDTDKINPEEISAYINNVLFTKN